MPIDLARPSPRALRRLAALPLLFIAAAATAQDAVPARKAPPPASALPASSPSDLAARSPTEVKVIEDGKVRIEETRLRGQTQNVTVHSKLPGVKSYEVIMPPLGKDPSQDKGAAGKRTWSLFDF